MRRGFVKQYRKELESDIWLMPPLYGRVWKWVILKAKWKKEIFPTPKKFGIHINPGQLITSYDIISDGIKWLEWGREKKPNKKTVKDILMWLEQQGMVTVVSNGKGTFICVINWDTYQPDTESKVTVESNAVVTQDKRLLETIKELKKKLKEKYKKVKKTTYGEFKNVLLSKEEHKKLTEKFNGSAKDKIENLSTALETYGYKYKSHYLVILSWAKKDKPESTSEFA